MMRSKDFVIKSEIEDLLESNFSGQKLRSYFENLPDNRIRRAIAILSMLYPNKLTVSDDDFIFIIYMLSNKKYLDQENFFHFIDSINIIDFTEAQKKSLIVLIKKHFETLCKNCTYELDSFLIKIFELSDLFKYMEMLAIDGSKAVLEHIFYILRCKDFSSSNVSDEAIEMLQQKISQKLL